MSDPVGADSEAIPVIRPGARPPSSGDHQAGPEQRRARTLRWLVLGVLGLMLVTLLGVIVVLPELVAERREPAAPAKPLAPVAPAPAPVETPAVSPDARELARHKRDAEDLLSQALRRKTELEAQDVVTWGGEDYQQALDVLAAGDAAFQSQSFAEAVEHYGNSVTALESLQASKGERLNVALETGERALADRDGELAREQFAIALAISPGDARAERGAARARVLEEVVALLGEGTRHLGREELEAALEKFQAARTLDPLSQEAKSAVDAVLAGIRTRDFRLAMSEALGALERGDFAATGAALERARALKPASAEVADVRRRLRLAVERSRIARHRKTAAALEGEERWNEAAEQYAAVLAIDAKVAFAEDGRRRSLERVRLHAELDAFLARPARLTAPEPRANARRLLEVARAVGGAEEPLLQKKVSELDALLSVAQAPMRVVLQSDNLTDVVVYKVGRVGRFSEHALTLTPGRYVAVGSRDGYRDVRVEFTLMPGRDPAPVVVRCEEKI
jgi:hypothetical protein